MKQYKVSLPDELYERLAAAGTKSGRSLSDEIRTRIELSLERDAVEEPMRDLLYAVERLGRLFRLDTGFDWAATLKGRQAMALAITEILEGEAPKHKSLAVEDLFGPLDPTTVAHMLARHYRNFIKTRDETDQELRRIHKERGKS
jgi:predicted DNA-binding protein